MKPIAKIKFKHIVLNENALRPVLTAADIEVRDKGIVQKAKRFALAAINSLSKNSLDNLRTKALTILLADSTPIDFLKIQSTLSRRLAADDLGCKIQPESNSILIFSLTKTIEKATNGAPNIWQRTQQETQP
jgi:hypothetical protein